MIKLAKLIKNLSPIDSLLSIGLLLQVNDGSKETSLALLLVWSIARLVKFAKGNCENKGFDSNRLYIIYLLIVSLLIIQFRTIVKHDDEHGITVFLLLFIGVVIGSALSKHAWKTLLNWLSLVTALLSIALLSFYEDKYEWMAISYRTTFNEGYGNINRLAIVLSLLTVASWYAFRQARFRSSKVLLFGSTILGYLACLGTDSRMAAISPLIGAIGSWGITHRHSLFKIRKSYRTLVISAILISPFVIIWQFVLSKDWSHGFAGDSTRLKIIRCWMNAIFTGHNRFLYGFGHQKEKIMELCTDKLIGNMSAHAPGSPGHAHNTYAHIIGLHGIFGLVFIGIIGYLAFKSIKHYQSNTKLISISECPWGECCTGLFITLFIDSICTTIHVYNHSIQLLIGLFFGAIVARKELQNNHTLNIK